MDSAILEGAIECTVEQFNSICYINANAEDEDEDEAIPIELYRYQVEPRAVCEWMESSDDRAGGRLTLAQSQLHFGFISPTSVSSQFTHDDRLPYTAPSLLFFSSLSPHHLVTSLLPRLRDVNMSIAGDCAYACT